MKKKSKRENVVSSFNLTIVIIYQITLKCGTFNVTLKLQSISNRILS